MKKKTVLVLGATGMIGNVLFGELSKQKNLQVFGTEKDSSQGQKYIISNVDVLNLDSLIKTFSMVKPEIVLNCVGIIKQLSASFDAALSIELNALFPHRLAELSRAANARMIHFSTDCVFSGQKGSYLESDLSDAEDIYGKTKFLGEVINLPHCLTLRTSCIGHEIQGYHGLVEWFLTQERRANGYTGAIYSGVPTVELAKILAEIVIPNRKLSGLYHVSSEPITKYDLLTMVAKKYSKKIEIVPDDSVQIDRTLNSSKFRRKTGYSPPSWKVLVEKMHKHYFSSPLYRKYH